jgi:hypothetical protein
MLLENWSAVDWAFAAMRMEPREKALEMFYLMSRCCRALATASVLELTCSFS